ncbi:FMN-linked oxidoreductase [Mycena crocata]|nr:FMN-linked oxidoreductase [Mycena crocata]
MATASSPRLFQPIQVGDMQLTHRVVLAPLTRNRVDPNTNVILPIVREYYAQRASIPGTLLIGEATWVAQKAGAYTLTVPSPGIWSETQITAWRQVTEAVHAKGSFIYCQLFAMGRGATTPELADPDFDFDLVSASAIPLPGETITPRELTVPEIQEYVKLFATAAENAVHKAGFDGVEIHGANGYLLDAFLQDTANQRTDAYGGSPENRARMLLETVSATVEAVGESKVAVRLSPWSTYQGMLMEDPIPTFSHVVRSLRAFPLLAYLSIIEPRVAGNITVEATADNARHSNDFIREIWGTRTLISGGAYTRETALERAENGEIIAFGRAFLANPDLPLRLSKEIPLTRGDRSTYYVSTHDPEGYTSYPFAK